MHNLKVETFSKYPYIPGKYGINFSDITDDSLQSTTSGSGRDMLAQVSYSRVEVTDMSRWNNGVGLFRMVATARENQISFALFTRSFDGDVLGERLPDFFAPIFAQCSLGFFDDNRLTKVESMFSTYNRGSSTEWSYRRARGSGHNPVQSAKLTWDGGLAKLLKFNKTPTVYDDGSNINVVWRR